MKKINLRQWLIYLFVLLLMLSMAMPTFAFGEDGVDRGETAVAYQDDHDEDDDDHHDDGDDDEHDHHDDEDDDHAHSDNGHHGEGQSIAEALAPFWVGLLGAVILSGGVNVSQRDKVSLIEYMGLALIGITGLVHLVGGIGWSSTLLILNGFGFLALGIAWVIPFSFIPAQKKLIPLILIVYTLITIVGYFATHTVYDVLGIVTKVVEVLLLIVLGISLFQQRNS